MATSGDDFHVKGVPAHAMVVKPCKTASQVSLACYLPHHTQTQREASLTSMILKGHRCVSVEFHMWNW